jgi:hypothetical protein
LCGGVYSCLLAACICTWGEAFQHLTGTVAVAGKLTVTTARRLRYAARRAAKSSRISGGAPQLATVRNSGVRTLWCLRGFWSISECFAAYWSVCSPCSNAGPLSLGASPAQTPGRCHWELPPFWINCPPSSLVHLVQLICPHEPTQAAPLTIRVSHRARIEPGEWLSTTELQFKSPQEDAPWFQTPEATSFSPLEII